MGRRGWSPVTEEEAKKLTLGELNDRIAAAKWAYGAADTNGAHKSCFKVLVELENWREKLHGVPAPEREFHRRRG